MRFYSSPKYLELLDFPLPSAGEKPTREEYLAYLRAFVRFHRLVVHTYETVVSISGAKGEFVLRTETRGGRCHRYEAERVVLAVGSTEFPRRLGIPGEDLPHVSHYFVDSHKFFGQRVVIVGARNSACDAAILLTRNSADVTLIHRRPQIDTRYLKYWIHPEVTGMIRRKQIDARMDTVVTAIDSEGVDLMSNRGETSRVDCNFVLLLIGYEPDYTLIEQLGLEVKNEQREPVIDAQSFETNVPGVYCCGTIVAGDQNPYRVFIENGQHHPTQVADAIEADVRRWKRCPTPF